MMRRVKGAIMAGILFTTFISWIPGHNASYLGEGSQVDGEGRVQKGSGLGEGAVPGMP